MMPSARRAGLSRHCGAAPREWPSRCSRRSKAREGEGQGQGQGQPGRAQRSGRGPGNGDDRDPLGRPTRSRGYTDGTVKVPGRGETDLQRAARVLEELRRRFSDPSRPRLELDYIERLLQRE